MKVKATNNYELKGIQDNELGRIPKEGEVFEISKERYEVLTKTNSYGLVFVEKVEEAKEIETATKKVETEKAVKKTTRKTTKKAK